MHVLYFGWQHGVATCRLIMTSMTLKVWQPMTTTTVTHTSCAKQAANAIKVYFRGLCIDGDDGP